MDPFLPGSERLDNRVAEYVPEGVAADADGDHHRRHRVLHSKVKFKMFN